MGMFDDDDVQWGCLAASVLVAVFWIAFALVALRALRRG